MSQRTHVPKFGNWESDGSVPYTQFFENARKGRSGGKVMNPNDPQDNPEAFRADVPRVHAPPPRTAPFSEATRPKDELHVSREDNIHRPNGSSLHHDSMAYRRTTDSHGYRDGTTSNNYQRRAGRVSGGSDYRVNHSPVPPNYQMNAGAYSSSEGLSGGSHALNSNSAGRLRMTGVQDDKKDKGSALPKFGEWDESDPTSADGFTGIFNKVREDKQTGSARVLNVSSDKTYVNGHEITHESSGCWCFSWCKK